MRYTLPDTIGRYQYALLDLTISGAVFRYTNAPGGLSVTDADGRTWLYERGLDATIPARSAGSVDGVGVSIDPSGEQWPEFIARGHRIDQARAVLRSCYADDDGNTQTLERCRVAIDGRLNGVAYGGSFQPLTGTVETDDLGTGIIPAQDAAITEATFTASGISDKALGKSYPVIIGTPGDGDYTTPAYLVTSANLLIAGHEVLASTVSIIDDEGNTATGLTVNTTTDALGRTYSYVTFLVTPWSADRTYYVAWDDGGGMADPASASVPLRAAGDVITWLLSTYAPGLRFDLAAQTAVAPLLAGYLLDFAIVSPVDPVAFVRSTIAPVLPLDEVRTQRGMTFRPRRIRAERYEVSAVLDADEGGDVDTSDVVSIDASKIANVISLEYAPAGREMGLSRAVIADSTNASDTGTIDGRRLALYPCLISQQAYGRRVKTYTTKIIHDDATAQQIVRDKIDEQATPRRYVSATGDTTLDRLETGDVVTITDTRLHLSGELAIVRTVESLGDLVTIGLEIVDDPARTSRATT